MNRKMGFTVVVASLAIVSGLLIAPAPAYSTEQGMQRREARDTRPECRQEKRDTKQDSRETARDIKY